MYKCKQKLSKALTWLVIITQILVIITSATVGTIQPTPQMAQTLASEFGWSDWLADRSADFLALGQRFWGELATAQAAVSYDNPTPLLSTTHSATITTGRTGLCTVFNCFITTSANVVDSNTANVGNINIPLGLAGGVYFSVDTNTTFPAGYRAGFLIDNGGGLIDLSLFSSFSLSTYRGGTLQETASSAALLDVSLFGGANSNAVSFVTTKDFDEVRLTAGSLIGALLNLDVYYAFIQVPAAPVLQSFTSTTTDGTYTNGDAIAICGNYDLDLAIGSTLNVTLDTGAALALKHTGVSIGGTINVDSAYVTGTGTNSYVHAMALQADGKAIIGGQFTSYNGTSRNRIARINSDGSLDTGFTGSGLNNYTEKIAMQADGKVVIVGHFTTVNGTARNYIARLNTDGSLDSSFTPTLNNVPYALVIQSDGKILISGSFSTVNGTGRTRIARLNSDGTLDTSFDPGTGLNNYTEEIVVQSDGKIVIGGHFTTVNGTSRTYIARLNSDGSLDTGFNPTLNNDVRAAALQSDGKIVIGGSFTTVNGTGRTRIARLNSDGTLDTTFDPGTGLNNYTEAIIVQSDGQVIIGGHFTDINGTARNRLARLNANGSVDTTFAPGTAGNNALYAMALQSDGKVVIGGAFTDFNGTARNYFTRLDGNANTTATPAKQVCATYRVVPGHNSTDLTVSAITSASVTSTSGGVSTATTLPSGQNLGDNKNLVIESSAPGGVIGNLQFWAKANAGAENGGSAATDGAGVDLWRDQSGNSHDAAQATVTKQPTFVSGVGANFNFNPTMDYLESQDELVIPLDINPTSAGFDPMSAFVVYELDSGAGSIAIWGNDDVSYDRWVGANHYSSGGGPPAYTGGNATNTPLINSTFYDEGASGFLFVNGKQVVNTTINGQEGGLTTTAIGGAGPNRSDWVFDGRIAEVIFYDATLTPTQRQQVESYLALKYGVTLDTTNTDATIVEGDYLAADGTTKVWNYTANTAYHNDVAGIGRDDAEAFSQKQSKSVNSGFQPAIGLGAIAASNAANANTFSANNSFLLWGDNGQAASYGANYTPTSFTPAGGYFRMNRVWKVQETGTITNVVVQATGAEHLLVSSDPTFVTGVSEIAVISGTVTANFTNGQYFTFGLAAKAPGGVAGATAWYRADAGITLVTGVSQWDDQTLNARDVTQATGGNQPTFTANGVNYNPVLGFNGSQYLSGVDTGMATGTAPRTMIGVAVNGIADGTWRYVFTHGTAGGGTTSGFGKSSTNFGSTHGWASDFVSTNPWTPINTPHLLYGDYTGTNARSAMDGGAITGAARSWNTTLNGFVRIGSNPNLSQGEFWIGDIGEVVTYNSVLSATDLTKVNSYLALKYGLTLDQTSAQNYLATDGSVVWDATTNSTYKNNIAGIARDDAEDLYQKQSKSINSGFQVAIGLGAIATDNASNANTFAAHKSYLIWGDNGLAASYGASYTPNSYTPTTGYYRMNRVWKVQETGTITNVVVQSGNADHLLVSSDPTFATGVTEIAFNSGSATVNFANGQYFTFGQEATGPGGVASVEAWFDSESGVLNASAGQAADGEAVATWQNRQTSENFTQGTNSSRPIFSSNTMVNFHPVVEFNRASNQFMTASSISAADKVDGSLFVVSQAKTINVSFGLFGFTDSMDYPGLHGLTSNKLLMYSVNFTPESTNTYSTYPVINGGMWQNGSPNVTAISLNGNFSTFAGTNVGSLTDKSLRIGSDTNWGAFDGNITEAVVFANNLTAAERLRVESYLAVKYGITKADDYQSSAATVIWSTTANAGYLSNVAGIGRDDASALNQKQSQSVNSGFQPTIGLGGIAASNAANSNTFSTNKSFLLWGSNTAATTLTANYAGGSNNRVARVWKVQETGTLDAVKVVIPRSAFPTVGLRSLIVHASDANFGTVDRTVALVSRGGNYEATVNFNNGDYFTFSSSSTLPEINVTPTTIDFGEVNVGSTSSAQAVTIQNQGEVSLNLTSIALSGADAARFAISSNNCGASLSAGASCTVQLTFTPNAADPYSALLVISNNDSDEGTVNVVLSGAAPSIFTGPGFLEQYNLAVTKSASVATTTVGVPFSYTITVYNKGTMVASNAVVTDQLPAGLAFNSATATGGGNCTHSSGIVTCTWASLANGASATVTISVTP